MGLKGVSTRRQYLELFLISLLGLYFEMLVVRWLAAEIRLFGYFKNFTLMAAFLGYAIGFALAGRQRDLSPGFWWLVLAYVPAVLVVGRLTAYTAVVVPQGGEYIWRSADLPQAIAALVFGLILLLFFVLTVFLFVPLGQVTGRWMGGLPPLSAYIANLAGSLCGILAFSGVSYLNLSPGWWFGLALAPLAWLLSRSNRRRLLSVGVALIAAAILAATNAGTLWSPYYRIDLRPYEVQTQSGTSVELAGYNLYVNRIGHMFAVDLSAGYRASAVEQADLLDQLATLYDVPYAFGTRSKVLVLGSGMGNDVAAGLRRGVSEIEAVEIDPLIYRLGLDLHPEHPYRDPRVRVIVDDARAFIESSAASYDLIVFGILDSQTLLSGMSSVRLDNFVYTLESLERAADRLSDTGLMVVTFDAEAWWIKQRLGEMLSTVFGRPPLILSLNDTPWTIYVAGEGATQEAAEAYCAERPCSIEGPSGWPSTPPATDDWPYLYLEQRGVPPAYWVALLVVTAVGWVSIRRAIPTAGGPNWHFFLLGAAYFLVEFRIITELALLFGSTWVVNAIGIAAVLFMTLVANVVVARAAPIGLRPLFMLLLGTLIIGASVPLRALLELQTLPRLFVSSIVLGLPLFFSSVIFAVSLKRYGRVPEALASNLQGSVLGGMLEYASLAIGIRGLYLLGGLLYVGSWIASRAQRQAPSGE